MAALPVLASFSTYFFWSPQGGASYGELIRPLALPDTALSAPDGTRFMLSGLRGRWILVRIGAGRCGEECARHMFLMRQVRLMQGKEMARLERLWLISDDAVPEAGLLQDYEGLRVGRAPVELIRLFPADRDPGEHLYLIDPLGNLMLRFPSDPDGRKMARDIARLLRVSHVG